MMMSPCSILPARPMTVFSVGAPAGTITHAARGLVNFLTKSSREAAPVAPLAAYFFTVSAFMSKTTHWWPCFINRSTMLPPIRPKPIIPNCTALLLSLFYLDVLAHLNQNDISHLQEQSSAHQARDRKKLLIQFRRVGNGRDLAVQDMVPVVGDK